MSSDAWDTLRERVKKLLLETETPLSAEEIAALLGLGRGETRLVYDALLHVAKTIRRESGGRLLLYMEPPRCQRCGYVFRDLKKPRRPSRCPRCRSERISPPRFIIRPA